MDGNILSFGPSSVCPALSRHPSVPNLRISGFDQPLLPGVFWAGQRRGKEEERRRGEEREEERKKRRKEMQES
jgi:hypothetical protein